MVDSQLREEVGVRIGSAVVGVVGYNLRSHAYNAVAKVNTSGKAVFDRIQVLQHTEVLPSRQRIALD
jgi:hypothetical protein